MSSDDKIVIETKSGKIKGTYQEDLYIFKGIPYAAPPVGEFRWLPPQPLAPWKGILRAQTFGPIAPQISGPPGLTQESQSEDCLYLNIWSPGLEGPKRPVMVWIHGGGWTSGSNGGATYDGTAFAENGVPSRYVELPSVQGHDAFLVDYERFCPEVEAYFKEID